VSCFIACPSTKEVAQETTLIKNILEEAGIRPIIAADYDLPNEEMLCTKICKNIIGSSFCIVLLTEVSLKGDSSHSDSNSNKEPNANVYFEYGLMTALYKNVIPLLKNGQRPKFDIQNLNLVMYDLDPANIDVFKNKLKAEIDKAKSRENQISEAHRRFINSFDKEVKANYELILRLRNWSGGIFNEQSWRNLIQEAKKIRHLYYDEFKGTYSLTAFSEEEAQAITDCYEDLIRLPEKAQDYLGEFQHNIDVNYPYKNDINAGEFRKELIKITDGLEKILIILKKDNEAYIKAVKPSFGI
jgi:hypothetical protein